jgi:excisionase family DNA binding protein
MGDDANRLMKIGEVAELTGLRIGTLYHLAAAGKIPAIRLSRRCLRFRRPDLEAWITAHSAPHVAEPRGKR